MAMVMAAIGTIIVVTAVIIGVTDGAILLFHLGPIPDWQIVFLGMAMNIPVEIWFLATIE